MRNGPGVQVGNGSVRQFENDDVLVGQRPGAAGDALVVEAGDDGLGRVAERLHARGGDTRSAMGRNARGRDRAAEGHGVAPHVEVAARPAHDDHGPGVRIGMHDALQAEVDDVAAAREGAPVDVVRGVARRTDHEFIGLAAAGLEAAPAAVGAGALAVDRGLAGTDAGVGIDGVDLDLRALERQVGGKAAVLAFHAADHAIQRDVLFGHDLGLGRCLAGDELMHDAEGCRGMGHFTVVGAGQDLVPGALERLAFRADVGAEQRVADPLAGGLGVLVVVVGTQGEPLDAGGHFVALGVLGPVQALQEVGQARELALFAQALDGPDAVGGRAGQNGVADAGLTIAVLDVVADGVAAAAAADEDDLVGLVPGLDGGDFGSQVGHVVGAAAAAGLGLGVVVTRVGVGQVQRVQLGGGPAVGLEAPQHGLPAGGAFAVVVHEQDGRVCIEGCGPDDVAACQQQDAETRCLQGSAFRGSKLGFR